MVIDGVQACPDLKKIRIRLSIANDDLGVFDYTSSKMKSVKCLNIRPSKWRVAIRGQHNPMTDGLLNGDDPASDHACFRVTGNPPMNKRIGGKWQIRILAVYIFRPRSATELMPA